MGWFLLVALRRDGATIGERHARASLGNYSGVLSRKRFPLYLEIGRHNKFAQCNQLLAHRRALGLAEAPERDQGRHIRARIAL